MDMSAQEASARMQHLLGQVMELLAREGQPHGLCIAVLVRAVGRLAAADGRTEPAATLMRACADVLQERGQASGNLQ